MYAYGRKPKGDRGRVRNPVSEMAIRLLRGAVATVAGMRAECARDQGRDFTRDRGLPLVELLWLIVTWGAGTLSHELIKAGLAGWATVPALIQQWQKLSMAAMPLLLATLNSHLRPVPWRGAWRLLAADGTEFETATNRKCRRSWHRATKKRPRGWNSAVAVCLYDLGAKRFLDMVFQGCHEKDERGALCDMLARLAPIAGLRDLVLADRGFASYNVFATLIETGRSFVIRATDQWVERLLGLEPGTLEGELDVTVTRVLTRSKGEADGDEDFRFVAKRTRFDHMGGDGRYTITLRVVRFRLESGEWECLVTDTSISAEDLRDIYIWRWGEEISFRELKCTIGLEKFHTRDLDRVEQEVWARLVLYNACSYGVSGLRAPWMGRTRKRACDRTNAFKAFLERLRGRDMDVESTAERFTHALPAEDGGATEADAIGTEARGDGGAPEGDGGGKGKRRKRSREPFSSQYRVCG